MHILTNNQLLEPMRKMKTEMIKMKILKFEQRDKLNIWYLTFPDYNNFLSFILICLITDSQQDNLFKGRILKDD